MLFRFFRPRCPILPGDKAWVEDRLNWLCREFGDARFVRSPVILPTAEYFPAAYDGSPESLTALFRRVCGFMDIPRGTVRLDLHVDPASRLSDATRGLLGVETSAAGLYHEDLIPTVTVEEGIVHDPYNVVAVLAHELSHVRLLNEGRISRERPDHEALTDLTAVFFGFGVFTVNFTARESHWSKEQGYLSKPIAAWALAHHAWARNDRKPEWLRHIGGEGSHWCKASLKYLFATGDTDFSPLVLEEGGSDDAKRGARP